MNANTLTIAGIGIQIDANDIEARSPSKMTVVRVASDGALLAVDTDQSGLSGVMRHLHGLGFVLMSIRRSESHIAGEENASTTQTNVSCMGATTVLP